MNVLPRAVLALLLICPSANAGPNVGSPNVGEPKPESAPLKDKQEGGEAKNLGGQNLRGLVTLRAVPTGMWDAKPGIAGQAWASPSQEWWRGRLGLLPETGNSPLTQDRCTISPPIRGFYRCRIEWRSGTRTFRVEAEIAQDFGIPTVDRIFSIIGVIVLQRMVFGRTEEFITRGQVTGLTKQRPKSRRFRPPLPYWTRPPVTLRDKLRQEAQLIEAAAAAAFTVNGNEAGRRLVIKSYYKRRKPGTNWSLASAPPNFYYARGRLQISINRAALEQTNNSDEEWGGDIAHEILHNFGWGHNPGDYRNSNAIEIYEACIEGLDASRLRATEVDDH